MERRLLGIALCCAAVGMAAMASATEKTILETVSGEIVLTQAGDGPWDWEVPHDEDADMPRGEAVDNTGRIYVCDSLRDRILVFTSGGSRDSIITFDNLRHPTRILVGPDNTLFVSGSTKDLGSDLGLQVRRRGGNVWEQVKIDIPAGPGADVEPLDLALVEPLYGRLRGLLVTVDGKPRDSKPRMQVVDEQNRFVNYAPSRYCDSRGRFYEHHVRPADNSLYMTVFDASGRILSKFDTPPRTTGPPVRYRGYIYLKYSGMHGHELHRYGDDGTLEEELYIPNRRFLAAPNSDHFFVLSDVSIIDGRVSFVVEKTKYRKRVSTDERR